MCRSSSSVSPFKKPINKLHLQRREWFIYQWPAPSLWMPKLHSPLQQIRRTCKAARSRGVFLRLLQDTEGIKEINNVHSNPRWPLTNCSGFPTSCPAIPISDCVPIVRNDPYFLSPLGWDGADRAAQHFTTSSSCLYFFLFFADQANRKHPLEWRRSLRPSWRNLQLHEATGTVLQGPQQRTRLLGLLGSLQYSEIQWKWNIHCMTFLNHPGQFVWWWRSEKLNLGKEDDC